MHARMIHGERNGHVFEQSQSYDVQGRVSGPMSIFRCKLTIVSSSEQWTALS